MLPWMMSKRAMQRGETSDPVLCTPMPRIRLVYPTLPLRLDSPSRLSDHAGDMGRCQAATSITDRVRRSASSFPAVAVPSAVDTPLAGIAGPPSSATDAAVSAADGVDAAAGPIPTPISAPHISPAAGGLRRLPSAKETATVAAAGAAVLVQVAALGAASPAMQSAIAASRPGAVSDMHRVPASSTPAATPNLSVDSAAAQRVAALQRRLAAELARSAGLQEEVARRDLRIRRLEVLQSARAPPRLGPHSCFIDMPLAQPHCMPCTERCAGMEMCPT